MSFEHDEVRLYGMGDGKLRLRVLVGKTRAIAVAFHGRMGYLGDPAAARRFGDCMLDGRAFPLEWCESPWLAPGIAAQSSK